MISQTIQELMDKFLQYNQVIKNYSPGTLQGYKSTFKLFLKLTGVKELTDLNKVLFEDWFFKGRLERKWSSVTYRHYHKHLNCFLKWLVKQELIRTNYLDGLEKPKLETRIPKTLSIDQAKIILDTSFHMPYRYKFEKFRNRAVIGIMLLAGLRRNEVVKLKLNDVSLDNKTIFINQGKGGKDRMIPINAKLNTILSEYLQDRKRIDNDSLHFFMSYCKEQSFGIKGINKLIAKIRTKTKVKFSAHTLRHAFARLMLEGGCDIYTLSKIMGHSKITTTTIYLACSNQQMSKSIEMHSLN